MSHEVENMFYVGATPWHNLGNRLIEVPNIDEAIIAAGLDWEVKTKPLFTEQGFKVDAQATYRTIDGKEDILGVVGPQYGPLQNKDAFKFFQPFLDSGEATLECAGSLREGKRIWVLAKINKDPSVIVGNDIVEKYILLSNSHDGTLAVRAGFTPIRVVCNNTLQLAIDNKTSKLIRIRHSGNVTMNLEKIRETMNLANQAFEATAEQYRLLANKHINQKDLEMYVKVVFNQDKTLSADEILSKSSRVLDNVQRLFETGRGSDMAGVRGTLWGAYNAITEYLQYERGTSEAGRLNEMWFGASAATSKKALEVAMFMAQAA